MPSPRFWKMCGVETKGAWPIQLAPSPPICVTASVRRSGSHTAMPWQPMPPSAIEPSGTTVEVLCGQPEQKLGSRIRPLRGGGDRLRGGRGGSVAASSGTRRASQRRRMPRRPCPARVRPRTEPAARRARRACRAGAADRRRCRGCARAAPREAARFSSTPARPRVRSQKRRAPSGSSGHVIATL